LTQRNIDFAPLVPELVCMDFARSLNFYCDILGFTRLYGREDPSFAYLDREGSQIMLEAFEDDGWITGEMQPPLGRGINLQIEASELDSMLTALETAALPLFRAPEEAWYAGEDRLYGQRQFLVQDPDGYLLRFCQNLGERAMDDLPSGARVQT